MQLSLSGFLFEDGYKSTSIDFGAFTNLACEAGYGGVELRATQVNLDTSDATLCRYRAETTARGLTVTCLTPRGMPGGGEERDVFFDRYLRLAGALGCGLLKLSGEPDWVRAAADRAARCGIALAGNTHVNGPTETVAGALNLVREVGHPNFGLLYDCLHLCIAGEDYLGALDVLLPHLRGVLVQCVRPARKGETQIAVTFKGRDYVKTCIDDDPIQDWSAVLGRLKQLGYDGWITVIENSWPQSARQDIARRTAIHVRTLWEQACEADT